MADVISDDMRIEYTRTKKNMFRAQKEYYVVNVMKNIPDPLGKRTWFSASKSIESDDYPVDTNYVRANIYMIGWKLEEVEPNLTKVTYIEEMDGSNPFLSKGTNPKSANFPNKIKEYVKLARFLSLKG